MKMTIFLLLGLALCAGATDLRAVPITAATANTDGAAPITAATPPIDDAAFEAFKKKAKKAKKSDADLMPPTGVSWNERKH